MISVSIRMGVLQEMPVISQVLESFFDSNKLGTPGWMSSLLIWPENFFSFRLFPLREHGMNWRAKPLTCQEIQVFILIFCFFFL